jgi:hypothetical protein
MSNCKFSETENEYQCSDSLVILSCQCITRILKSPHGQDIRSSNARTDTRDKNILSRRITVTGNSLFFIFSSKRYSLIRELASSTARGPLIISKIPSDDLNLHPRSPTASCL